MRHDPRSDLTALVAETLTTGYQVADDEATRIAQHVRTYLTVDDIGGAHFELLNVTLRWHALCGAVAKGELAVPDRWAGVPLIGVLRWVDGMRYYHQAKAPVAPHREDLAIDHAEAAACMALWRQEAEAESYSPDDTPAALLKRVNAILQTTPYDPIDTDCLREAMDRLKTIHCLTPRAGWLRLREEMKYQVPEE